MTTQVIFLFGRPGVGKLTVGELLAIDTGYRLLHNHAVVDLVTSLFSFGSPPFVALREKLWLDAIDACVAAKQEGVIMTFAPHRSPRLAPLHRAVLRRRPAREPPHR